MSSRSRFRRALAIAAAGTLGALALPAAALAADQCTPDGVTYDTNVLTWDDFFRANPRYSDAIVPFAAGAPGRSTGKNTTANIDRYFQAVTNQINNDPEMRERVAVKEVMFGKSELGNRGVNGRDLGFWVVSTPQNIANFEDDGAFWADVRDGRRSEAEGLAAIRTRPAIGWVTATPHGNEPAAGEAITRQLYELVARTDCANLRRLQNLDVVLDPVRNPDGRDNNVRTTSWGFDPNRDFGVRNYVENGSFLPYIARYPGLFFIDAHQQGAGYFFPPNEDPVHHEISNFALDFIQNRIGPKLQQTFNDQSSQYQNYNSYDMFTPEYGDTVPSLLMGAAGMTYEKGSDENYGKQVYDHYLAIDTTINLTSNDKVNLTRRWVEQWEEARQQGESCSLQENKLVSPLHESILQQPQGKVCGYFYRPDLHEGDVARLMRALREVGVHIYTLDQDTASLGIHTYGMPTGIGRAGILPKGTLWIPMSQPQKHWLQAILGEDPFIPYNYYYDVVTWSFGMQRGLAGDGHLTEQMPAGTPMTEVDNVNFGSVPARSTVYAFDTDSMEALALVVELLDRGVNVYRATSSFDANGVHYESGAALVDGASLASSGADLSALATRHSIPVTGLANYPVARKQLRAPKIGVYTTLATNPTNPLNLDAAAVNNGTATRANNGQCPTETGNNASAYCEAMFVLTQKDRLPASIFVPVTSTDLAAGAVTVGNGFTALVNPAGTIAAGAGATALQTFVNDGGIYVGYNAGGATSARNAGVTTLNTASISGLNTPGSTFDASFDTTSPVAWGFDEGGWIYRDSTSNPVFDRATLGTATAAVSYAGAPMRSYGFSVNALGSGQLGGRPAVVDQPFGSGRAVMFGFNPFYRSWKEQDERLVLNSVLYPLGAALPATAASRETAKPAAEQVKPAAAPVAAKKLPAVTSRPTKKVASIDKHVMIRVTRKQGPKLRAAVKTAKLSKSVRKRVSYKVTKTTVTLTVKNVRTADAHERQMWVARIMGGLKQRGVQAKMAQL
ncbi:M14 family zinc carboxypeptidase [Conexibacter sp. JD483]|uniref:M14 family zinc carboxypeptidase n=1 Tax=unclassified Conexibacter TaxID=2627773 RepID=UPI00271A22C9|nr:MULTISPECIES: M14 family zinc carboxypeptidase [unclassified Conexibacter]MDO8187070.1 M14 family zinc carboxypeptidase [Conexibacter sp. CPCC 205706]MDO8200928.1 M14 family zinc carboxypeptidase [Conexibacter sp. CPCC 205762]MDR9371310.1 M14 family zinc carboxypeptidase [Conexibacter sp. JD483]